MAIRAWVEISNILQGDGIATTLTFDLKTFKTFPFDLTLVTPSSVIATDMTGTPPIAITAVNTGTSVTLTFAVAFNGFRTIGLRVLF